MTPRAQPLFVSLRAFVTVALFLLSAGGGGCEPRTQSTPAPAVDTLPSAKANGPADLTLPDRPPMLLGDTEGLRGRLQELLNESASATETPFSIHVRTADGIEAGILAEQPEPAASLAKAPLLAALEAAWADGSIDRRPQDAALVRAMITRSDNAAADQLLRRIGAAAVNVWLDGQDYRLTRLGSGFTPPKASRTSITSAADMSRLMLDLARGNLVSTEASAEMRALLEAQTRRGRIPAGLPPEAVCGNKTGTLDSLTHDAGYVIPPDAPPYGIAVLINAPGNEPKQSALIKSLSSRVYDLLSRR